MSNGAKEGNRGRGPGFNTRHADCDERLQMLPDEMAGDVHIIAPSGQAPNHCAAVRMARGGLLTQALACLHCSLHKQILLHVLHYVLQMYIMYCNITVSLY